MTLRRSKHFSGQRRTVGGWCLTQKRMIPKKLPSYTFKDTIPSKFLTEYVDKAVYLKFMVTNSADSAMPVFFHPGYYFTEIKLFTYDSSERKVKEEADTSRQARADGYRELWLQAGETKAVYAKLKSIKSPVVVYPRLAAKTYIQSLVNNMKYGERDIHIFTYIFCGVLLMMIFYSLAVFFLEWRT